MTQAGNPTPSLTPGDLGELLATFNDVTVKLQASHEHLRAEVARLTEELRAANEAVARAQRLAALGEMAAGIAHEIRNPLGSIRLYARMLEQDLSAQPVVAGAAQAGLAGKITGAARVVEGIVHDVLAFAREFKVRCEPVDACEAMHRAFAAACEGHTIDPRFVERLDVRWMVPASGLKVEADAALLHHALLNIVQNAIQAMQGDAGTPNEHDTHQMVLGVRTSAMVMAGGLREPVALLSVRDSGPGMSEDTIARMFNPFFTTRAQGTGLGLAIVHRIVDAHAGRIEVMNNAPRDTGDAGQRERRARSPQDRGATVQVILPLRKGSVPIAEQAGVIDVMQVGDRGPKRAQRPRAGQAAGRDASAGEVELLT